MNANIEISNRQPLRFIVLKFPVWFSTWAVLAVALCANECQAQTATGSFNIYGEFQGEQVEVTFTGIDASLYNSLVLQLQGSNLAGPQITYLYDAMENSNVPIGSVAAQVLVNAQGVIQNGPGAYISPSSPQYRQLIQNVLLWAFNQYCLANLSFENQLNSQQSLWNTTWEVDSTIGQIDSLAGTFYSDITSLVGDVEDATGALDPNEAQQFGSVANLLYDSLNYSGLEATNPAEAQSVLTVLTENGVVSGPNYSSDQVITGLASLTPNELSTVESQLENIVGIQSQNLPQTTQQYISSLVNNLITGGISQGKSLAVGTASSGGYSGFMAYIASQSLGAESPGGIAWAAGANSARTYVAGAALPLATVWVANALFQTSVEPQLPLLQDQFVIAADLDTNIYPEAISISTNMFSGGLPYFSSGGALTVDIGVIDTLTTVYDQIQYDLDPENYGPPTSDQQNLQTLLTLLSNSASFAQNYADTALNSPLAVVSGISLSHGIAGDEVTVTGSEFSGAIAVYFGNNPAAAFVVNSSTEITAYAPSGSGTVDVTVVTLAGASQTSAADQFTYGPTTAPTAIQLACTVTPNNNVMESSPLTVSGTATYNNNGGTLSVGTVYISLAGQTWTTPINAGNFTTTIYAPTNSGTFSVSCQTTDSHGLTGSCSAQISVQANGSSSSFNNVILLACENVSGNSEWNFVDALPGFPTTLPDIYAWCELQNVYGAHTGEFKIYNPSGQYEGYADFTIPNATTQGYSYWAWYDVWDSWVVPGDALSSEPGLWTLILYIDGSYQQTIPFIMGYDMYEQVMCKSVEQSSPYNPVNQQNVFQSTDQEAVAWTQLGTVSDPLQVKYVWTQPNGSVYFTYTNTIPAPSASEFYYQSYECWCYISIAGTAAANDCGNWQVDVYISDNNGPWQHQYSDSFTIVKNPATPPAVSASANESSVVSGQSVAMNVTASDSTYLQTVSLYWFDGAALHSNVWNSIFADNLNQSFSIGPYSAGAQVQYWAIATDTSGNSAQSAAGQVQFLPLSGSLQVDIDPQIVVSLGAMYQINGGAWQTNALVPLSVGTYTVIFAPVNGWITPTNETVTVTADQMTEITGTYGSLSLGVGQPAFGTNGFNLLLYSPVGTSVSLQVSTDMIHWYTWTNLTVPYSPYWITDNTATNATVRVYRAVTGIPTVGVPQSIQSGGSYTGASLGLPAGAELYIFGAATGGAHAMNSFVNGEPIQITNANGNVSAQLVIATTNYDAFTSSTLYNAIGGLGVFGFNDVQAFYEYNPGPGQNLQASVQFSLSTPALVIVVGLGSSQNTLTFSGLDNPAVDVPGPNGASATEDLAIEHEFLGPGNYTIQETTGPIGFVSTSANEVDLLGVLIFSTTPDAASSTSPQIPLPAGF